MGNGVIPYGSDEQELFTDSNPAAMKMGSGETVGLTEKTIWTAMGTVSTTGGVVVKAAPGSGSRLVITRLKLQNESETETLVEVKTSTVDIERLLLEASKTMGESIVYPVDARPKGADNEAISLHLGGANQVGYTIHGYTEDV